MPVIRSGWGRTQKRRLSGPSPRWAHGYRAVASARSKERDAGWLTGVWRLWSRIGMYLATRGV